jgi:hypothetical protein
MGLDQDWSGIMDAGQSIFELTHELKAVEQKRQELHQKRDSVLSRLSEQLAQRRQADYGRGQLKRFAYVTLVTGHSGYAIGALALGASLENAGSKARRICLITESTSAETIDVLIASGLWDIAVVADLPCSADADARCNKLALFKRPLDVLASLKRYIFLDADAYVRENLDHLFTTQALEGWPLVGARNCPLWPSKSGVVVDPCSAHAMPSTKQELREESISLDPDNFNSGMMLIDPLLASKTDVLKYVKPWNQTWDGDQDPLNELFGNSPRLGIEFNTLMCCADLPALGERAFNAKVVHFSLKKMKPWDVYKFEAHIESEQVDPNGAIPAFRWWSKGHPFNRLYSEWKRHFQDALERSIASVPFEF